MQDFRQEINARASMDLEQRRTWYSPVADIYYNARPHYPKELIDRSVALAQLDSDASILEVGCVSLKKYFPKVFIGESKCFYKVTNI